ATPAPAAPPKHVFTSPIFAACNDAAQRNISQPKDDGSKRWEVNIRGGSCNINMRAEGTVKFKPDFTDIDSVSPGGYLTLKSTINGETNELDVRPGAGGLA